MNVFNVLDVNSSWCAWWKKTRRGPMIDLYMPSEALIRSEIALFEQRISMTIHSLIYAWMLTFSVHNVTCPSRPLLSLRHQQNISPGNIWSTRSALEGPLTYQRCLHNDWSLFKHIWPMRGVLAAALLLPRIRQSTTWICLAPAQVLPLCMNNVCLMFVWMFVSWKVVQGWGQHERFTR